MNRAELIQVLEDQHVAIDILFARLINITRDRPEEEAFFPSKSGKPWQAANDGFAMIQRLKQGEEIT